MRECTDDWKNRWMLRKPSSMTRNDVAHKPQTYGRGASSRHLNHTGLILYIVVVCVCFESGWRDGGGREGDGEGLTEVQAASFCYVLAHSWVWVSMNGFYQTLNGLIYAIKPRGCFSVAGDSQEYWKATTSSSFRTYILSMPNLVSTLFVPLTIFNIVCVLSHFLPVSSNSSGPASSEEFGAAEKHELGIYPACCFISLP